VRLIRRKKMDTHYPPTVISKTQVIQALMRIRHEWETAALGDSLIQITGSVGFLLFDIAISLGLEGRDLKVALGDLADEVLEELAH
jgi:hypothetical protein